MLRQCLLQPAALFAQPGYGSDARETDVFAAARVLKCMRALWRIDPPGTHSLGTAGCRQFPAPETAPPRAALPEVDANPDKIVYLAFTSGTTGQPKGVMHSDNTLLANGRAMVQDWHHDERTVLYSHSPLSHHIGTVAIEQALVAGCELVLNDLPPEMNPLDWILETGATYVMGVPTHDIDILADMAPTVAISKPAKSVPTGRSRFRSLPSMRTLNSPGACTPSVAR